MQEPHRPPRTLAEWKSLLAILVVVAVLTWRAIASIPVWRNVAENMAPALPHAWSASLEERLEIIFGEYHECFAAIRKHVPEGAHVVVLAEVDFTSEGTVEALRSALYPVWCNFYHVFEDQYRQGQTRFDDTLFFVVLDRSAPGHVMEWFRTVSKRAIERGKNFSLWQYVGKRV